MSNVLSAALSYARRTVKVKPVVDRQQEIEDADMIKKVGDLMFAQNIIRKIKKYAKDK